LNCSCLQLVFRAEPQLARKAAVMRGNRIFAKAFFKVMGHSFRESARIDEHKSRTMLAN
jgi:hypothetical protein